MISKEALDAAAAYLRERAQSAFSGSHEKSWTNLLARHFQSVIDAERERCAGIARSYRENAGGSRSYADACRHIEAQIMRETTNEPQ